VTFDRSRAALDALSGMSRNEIDRITSLAITGESIDRVEEIVDAEEQEADDEDEDEDSDPDEDTDDD
jgi:hypothetical protein